MLVLRAVPRLRYPWLNLVHVDRPRGDSHTPQSHRTSHKVSGGTRPAHQIPARPPPCFLQTLDVLIFSRAANFFLPWRTQEIDFEFEFLLQSA
ncbi:hypothetical protein PAPYR_11219 [Paratrimastix pyriformis]|uniref:Uncharacterized protein n=1 Tax=Paratrimastix pyriformis TaxID=342808 RepID=A0ABQ8U484_9EUKA|nr:hypothetical protein PAPYR_11219 [Paratrimastix pyriformis]